MPELTLPYMLGVQGSNAAYAFYPSGAVRRVFGMELGLLKDEFGVRTVEISGDDSGAYAALSQRLFGV